MESNEFSLIAKTKAFVRTQLEHAEGGHDWWHISRVHRNAINLADGTDANLMVVELAALLHDIADSKFHGGDEAKGPAMAVAFLRENEVDDNTIADVEFIIRHMSFKNSFSFEGIKSLEFQIVEDADRIDALGAIGIARAFSYGGFKLRPFYDPDIPPANFTDGQSYKSAVSPTINHFYEKLFLLKDMMNTTQAKAIAEKRHQFMLQYLDQFYSEWEGQD
jgi:uncharacterized protein